MKYHRLFLYCIVLSAMQGRIFVMDAPPKGIIAIQSPKESFPIALCSLIDHNKQAQNTIIPRSEQASLMMVNRESYFYIGRIFYEYKKEKRKEFLHTCISACLGACYHPEWDEYVPSRRIISLPLELCNCHNEETIKKLMDSLMPRTLMDLQQIVSKTVLSLAHDTRRINYCYSDSSVVTHIDLEDIESDVKSKQLTEQEYQDNSSTNTFLQILVINQQSNNWTDVFNECLKKDISSVIIIMHPLLNTLSREQVSDMVSLIISKLPKNADLEVMRDPLGYFPENRYERLHRKADSYIDANTMNNKSYPNYTFLLFGVFLLCLGAVVYKESISALIENNFPSLAHLLYNVRGNYMNAKSL